METTPAASLHAGAGEELSSALVWPVSLVPPVSRHGPWALSYARAGARSRNDLSASPQEMENVPLSALHVGDQRMQSTSA